jgi:chemotaxis protein CheD
VYKYFNAKFEKEMIDISPGEYLSTSEDFIISTVLGSCVSVCIFDKYRKMGGMNHFMLVEGKALETTGDMLRYERYGSYAMESLLNDFIRSGSKKEHLEAKVFGGSRMLNLKSKDYLDIGSQNVRYALTFLKNETIPVLAKDTGGTRHRRLYLFPQNFKILMKREQKDSTLGLYVNQIPKKESPIVLFDP